VAAVRGDEMRSRSQSLEFALLGFLSQSPLHGYELRKRLIAIYGPYRALSFSVLYPQLRRMLLAGVIEEISQKPIKAVKARKMKKTTKPARAPKEGGIARRSRIVYRLTAAGHERFSHLTQNVTPDTWEDEGFEVRFAFFSPTSPANRLRILEGRHRRLKDKAEILRTELKKSPAGIDKYLEEWRRHSLESADREIAWLEKMITIERK